MGVVRPLIRTAMLHSARIRWLEIAYGLIRRDLLPEAPGSVTITLGLPSRKGSPANPVLGECHFEVVQQHGEEFGGENLVVVHFATFDDPVRALAALTYAMIRHALDPDEKHGSGFRAVAQRVGLEKPWQSANPSDDLVQTLRGIALEADRELGREPAGFFQPPPKPARDAKAKEPKRRFRCQCESPRILSIPKTLVERGDIICSLCSQAFRMMELEEAGAQ
jgi:hypothetical protein